MLHTRNNTRQLTCDISQYCRFTMTISIQWNPTGMKFLASLQYSHEQVAQVEVTTRAQRLCSRWQQERQFRITASKFGTVVKRRNHNLAKQLLYSQVSSGTVSALLWGQHEADALVSYKTKLDWSHSK